ncbi:unnamed protein product [Rotaria magnacalcarata]
MHSNCSALGIYSYPSNLVSYLGIHLDTQVVDIMTSLDEQHDLCSEMDKSDCIILCISGNYYENPSCISEAKKLFVNSLGSDLYFDLEYGRLLIELPGFAALLQRRSSRVQ